MWALASSSSKGCPMASRTCSLSRATYSTMDGGGAIVNNNSFCVSIRFNHLQLDYSSIEQIHFHAHAATDTQCGGSHEFLRSVLVLDVIDGLVEVDVFFGVVEKADLVVAEHQPA